MNTTFFEDEEPPKPEEKEDGYALAVSLAVLAMCVVIGCLIAVGMALLGPVT